MVFVIYDLWSGVNGSREFRIECCLRILTFISIYNAGSHWSVLLLLQMPFQQLITKSGVA